MFVGLLVVGLGVLFGPLTGTASSASTGSALLQSPGCSVFSAVNVYAETPRLEWPRVWTTGGIDYYGAPYCYPDLSGVYAQTKACGVFGCNWQTRGSVTYTPWGGMRETPGMDCRRGTNRYRTHTAYGYRIWGQTGLEPALPIVHDSTVQPEFSCK
jgi:hypothetical protein